MASSLQHQTTTLSPRLQAARTTHHRAVTTNPRRGADRAITSHCAWYKISVRPLPLGPALILLACFEHARGAFEGLLATFGQVPFFYYVVHIYLIHGLAVSTGFALTGTLTSMPAIGFRLPGIYFVWLLMLVCFIRSAVGSPR
jgi:hypothetical protein